MQKTIAAKDDIVLCVLQVDENGDYAPSGGGGLVQGLTDDQLRASAVSVKPVMATSGNLTATTTSGSNGSTFVALPSQACTQVTVCNNTGVNIEVQQGGSGGVLTVFVGSYYTFFGLTNANQLAVRRADQSASPTVSVQARWEA